MVPTPGTVLSSAFLLFSGYNVLCGSFEQAKMCNQAASLATGLVGLVGAALIAYLDRSAGGRSWRARGAQVIGLARGSRIWLAPERGARRRESALPLTMTAAPRNWRIATGGIVARSLPALAVDAPPVPRASRPARQGFQYKLKCPNAGAGVPARTTATEKRSQSADRRRPVRQEALCRECNQWFKSAEACMDHFIVDWKQ